MSDIGKLISMKWTAMICAIAGFLAIGCATGQEDDQASNVPGGVVSIQTETRTEEAPETNIAEAFTPESYGTTQAEVDRVRKRIVSLKRNGDAQFLLWGQMQAEQDMALNILKKRWEEFGPNERKAIRFILQEMINEAKADPAKFMVSEEGSQLYGWTAERIQTASIRPAIILSNKKDSQGLFIDDTLYDFWE